MILLDTSGLFCCIAPEDEQHVLAAEILNTSNERLVHSGVLMEVVALLEARREPRESTLNFIEMILDSRDFEIVWLDELDYRESLKLLRNRRDKQYSLCDAASFVLMRRFKIREALTTDHHFEQEGFVRLLK